MPNPCIKQVFARQVMGRKYPAVSATVITEGGAVTAGVCSAGVSVGTHEVPFAYDGGEKWNGKGLMNAIHQVNDIIAPALIGMDCREQALVDYTMLGLPVGGNAVAAVSAAVLKAGAESLEMPIYRHIGGADAVTLPCAAYGVVGGSNRYDKYNDAGAKPTYAFIAHDYSSFSEAHYALWEAVMEWQNFMMKKYGLSALHSVESITTTGFVYVPPGIVDREQQLWEMLNEAIDRSGHAGRIGLQVDLAADCFYDREARVYRDLFCPGEMTRDDIIATCKEMADKYNFVSIEDPLHEDDYEGHALLTKAVDIQIVGDDLFTTMEDRVLEGVKAGAANCVLLKVNQVGSITQSLEMIQLAYENGYGIMPCSSRGEGVEICDYAVGINCGTIRESGLGSGGTRFLEIEKELGSRAVYAGTRGLKGNRFQRFQKGGK